MPPAEDQGDRNFDFLLWRSPELMRQQMPPKGSQVCLHSSVANALETWSIDSSNIELFFFPLCLQKGKQEGFSLSLGHVHILIKVLRPNDTGDVYSFGILLQQIIVRSAPFDAPGDATKVHQTAKELVMEVSTS